MAALFASSHLHFQQKGSTMRILVIGSGGREHSLVWKLSQSPLVEEIFVAPGNAGTGEVAANVDIAADDIPSLVNFAKKNNIDLVVAGPEAPLTLGITDALARVNIPCFGPDAHCARLEGSKSFAKEIMNRAGVPTAASETFTDAEKAREYAQAARGPVVVKADGLAAGKGVVVAKNSQEALEAIDNMLEKRAFGAAGETILIEEKLDGEEVSLLCLCDGETVRPLPSAQDHKPVYDGDEGPNTGGMGAYSPAPVLPDERLEEMADLVARPIVREMAKEGHPFVGVLYAGLMMTPRGPKVLEYNVRFGDPECQPLMARLKSDLAAHMRACVRGKLSGEKIEFRPEAALGVVLAARGYPGHYPKGMPIDGLDDIRNANVFIGGARREKDQVLSDGGRVLCVTAVGDNLEEASKKAYAAMEGIHMPDSHYRRDIGAKGIKRLGAQKKAD